MKYIQKCMTYIQNFDKIKKKENLYKEKLNKLRNVEKINKK